MTSRLRARLPHAGLFAGILVLAAALRFSAIDFGFPYAQARPDETTAAGHAVAMLGGDLNPHFFNWPSLALYLFAATLAVAKAAGVSMTGTHPILIARVVVAAAGTLTVLPTAAVAARFGGMRTALTAALFLAVAPLHVRDSHFATTDVLMTLLVVVSLAIFLRARASGSPPLFAAAGIAGGLATSTKYSAAVILAAAAAAPSIAAALAFCAAWAVGFFATTPFALLDFPAFAADTAYERAHLSSGHAVALGRGWLYHLHTTLPYGLGLATAVAAAIGIPIVALRHRPHALALGLVTAAFYLAIGSGYTVFFRYALPLLPLACVFAAVAVNDGGTWLGARGGTAVAAIAIALAAPSFYQSVQLDRLLAREDARVIAGDWLAAQLRPEHTVHDSGGDYTRLALGTTPYHAWRYDPSSRSFGDPAGGVPEWIVLYESPLPEYTAAPDSLRELVHARYDLAQRVNGVPAAARGSVYDRQDAFFLPIAGFKGVARPGPTVLIYRLRR